MVNLRVVRYYSSMPIRVDFLFDECVRSRMTTLPITCPQKIQVCSKDVKMSESFSNDRKKRAQVRRKKKTISEVTF